MTQRERDNILRLLVISALLAVVVFVMAVCDTRRTTKETTEDTLTQATEAQETQNDAEWGKDEGAEESASESPVIAHTDIEPERVTYWADIPLDRDVQAHVFNLCEQRDIDPAVVFAMIWRETRYDVDAIGDSGYAFGLLQIQPRWHGERMERLGCTDLLDPIQNITVGVDYLAEMIERGNGLEWALCAYNAGASGANKRGGTSQYTREVMEEAERIRAKEEM